MVLCITLDSFHSVGKSIISPCGKPCSRCQFSAWSLEVQSWIPLHVKRTSIHHSDGGAQNVVKKDFERLSTCGSPPTTLMIHKPSVAVRISMVTSAGDNMAARPNAHHAQFAHHDLLSVFCKDRVSLSKTHIMANCDGAER